jgi:hypothetical protein
MSRLYKRKHKHLTPAYKRRQAKVKAKRISILTEFVNQDCAGIIQRFLEMPPRLPFLDELEYETRFLPWSPTYPHGIFWLNHEPDGIKAVMYCLRLRSAYFASLAVKRSVDNIMEYWSNR